MLDEFEQIYWYMKEEKIFLEFSVMKKLNEDDDNKKIEDNDEHQYEP